MDSFNEMRNSGAQQATPREITIQTAFRLGPSSPPRDITIQLTFHLPLAKEYIIGLSAT